MKNKFEHLKLPNEKEIKKLWEDCLFVFDTNILLNLYRYSDKTKNDFLNILKSIQDRIWIPYQVGFEYHNNRIDLIEGQVAKYDNFLKNIKSALSKAKSEITAKKSHPYIDIKLIDKISKIIDKESVKILKEKIKVEKLIKNDLIELKLNSLFENNVGEQFSDKVLKEILIEGEYRYNNKIPPGYEDLKNKSSIRKYGDLIIWFEMIEKSKLIKKPILFVTDDLKEDWWKTSNKKKIPRSELIQEFFQKSDQKYFMYHSDEFMTLSEKYLNQNINPKSIEEAKDIRYDLKKLNDNINATKEFMYHEIYNQIRYLIEHNPLKLKQTISNLNTILPDSDREMLLSFLEKNYKNDLTDDNFEKDDYDEDDSKVTSIE